MQAGSAATLRNIFPAKVRKIDKRSSSLYYLSSGREPGTECAFFAGKRIFFLPFSRTGRISTNSFAGVAQLAEQLICNQQVAGSSPIAGSRYVVEFPSGQREQTVNLSSYDFGSSNLPSTTRLECKGCRRQKAVEELRRICGNSSMARASAFQAEGCEFESRFPLHSTSFVPPPFLRKFYGEAHVAQSAERVLGKDEVSSSILLVGSISPCIRENKN